MVFVTDYSTPLLIVPVGIPVAIVSVEIDMALLMGRYSLSAGQFTFTE